MNLEIWTPAIGQQEMLDHTLELVVKNAKTAPKCFVIDNGSREPLRSSLATVIRNDDNLGMIGSLIQARENCQADILVFMHSDMEIFEEGWDVKVIQAFEADSKLAALGVVGAVQADSNGGRSGTVCAFRDGHLHGTKPRQEITPVALLDGCWMAFRNAYLEHLDFDGFESNGYLFSYDKDLTLTLTMESLHVGVINLDSQHIGGQTSCREEFNDSLAKKGQNLNEMYRESERRYINKWKACFPVRVKPDWVVNVGTR